MKTTTASAASKLAALLGRKKSATPRREGVEALESRIAPAVIYQSATAAGHAGGYGFSSGSFAGVRFEAMEDATVQSLGASAYEYNGASTGFLALVALTGPTDFPDSSTLTTPDVLATTTFDPTPTLGDRSGTLATPVQIEAGQWYAIVGGGGLFGASGNVAFNSSNTTIGTPNYFVHYSSFSNPGFDYAFRFFAEGNEGPAAALGAALDGDGKLTITDTGSVTNNLSVSVSGLNLLITDAVEAFGSAPLGGNLLDGGRTLSIPLASITGGLVINGGGGNDKLTLDFGAGNLLAAGGLSFNGGAGGFDSLVIQGGAQGTVTYSYTNANDGSIAMSSFGTVTYTGLEPISNSGTATEIVFVLPAGLDQAVLEDDGTLGNGTLRLRSGNGSFETTVFSTLGATSVRIETGGGADTLTVDPIADLSAALTLGVAANPFSVISLNTNVTTTLSGAATLVNVAAGASINDGVAVAVSGGTVDVAAGTFNELVTVNKTLTLLGEQAGVDARTGRVAASETILANAAGSLQITASGVTVDGFTIQGATLANPNGAAGIYTSGTASGYQIVNNIIQGNSIGLYLNSGGGTQTVVEKNLIRDNNLNGAGVPKAGVYSDQGLLNTLFQNNKVSGDNTVHGLNLSAANGVTISGNEFANGNLLRLFGSQNTTISGNTFTGSLLTASATGAAVNLGGGNNGVSVTGNTFTDRGSRAILASDAGFGFGTNSNLTISNNTITQNVGLIASAARNMIDLRGVAGTSSVSGNTLTLSGATNGTVTHVHGLEIGGSMTGTVNVTGNTFTGGGVDAFTGTNDSTGIRLLNTLPATATVTVNGNTSIGGWVHGVEIGAVPAGITVQVNNNAFANEYTGIKVLSGAASVQPFAGNSFSGVTYAIDAGSGNAISLGATNLGANATLRGNNINFTGGAGSITGSGTLTILGATAGTSIGLGNGAAGTLLIDSTDLAAVATILGLAFGDATSGNATISVGTAAGTLTIPNALTLHAPAGGGVSLLGTLNLTGGVTIHGSGATTILNGATSTGGANFIVNDAVEVQGNSSVNTAGGALTITSPGTINADAAANNRTLALDAGSGTLTIAGAVGGSQALHSLALSGANLAALPAITVGAGGLGVTTTAGAINLNGTVSSGGSVTLTSAAGITFNAALTVAANQGLTANASGTISLANTNADLSTSGTGTISLTTGRDIVLASGSSITTVNGALTLNANQQATPTSGNFIGVDVNGGLVQATGTGTVTVTGRGGNAAVDDQSGVRVAAGGDILGGTLGTLVVTGTGGAGTANGNSGVAVTGAGSSISSAGANVQVTAFGGGSAGAGNNIAVYVLQNGLISAGGSGTVTVQGTGGGFGNGSHGVLAESGGTITSGGGNVQVTGQGGGNGTGAGSYGVGVSGGTITAGGAGSVTISGTGGTGTGGSHSGVVLGLAGQITSGGGSVSVTGTPGTGGTANFGIDLTSGTSVTTATNGGGITLIADSMNLAGAVSANAASTVTLRQKTNGVEITLGTKPAGELSLTDAELDNVSAGTLQVGDANTGAFEVRATLSQNKNLSFTSPAGINLRADISTDGGANAGTLGFTGPVTIDVPVTLDTDHATGSDAAISFSSTLALNANTLTLNAGGANYTIAGVISGAAGGDLVKQGTGTLTLDGDNTFAGNLTISAGTIKLGPNDAIPNGAGKGNVSIAAGATLDLNGFNEFINGLSGAGTVDNTAAGGAAFEVGHNNATSTFSGVIQDTGGNIALTKVGTGTLTLTGNNSYAGLTTISEGVVNIRHNNALGATGAAAKTIVASGARLELEGNITNVNEIFTLSGTGGGLGALRFVSSNNFINGAIDLDADTLIVTEAAAGNSILSTIDTDGFALTLNNAALLQLSSISDNGSLTKQGVGTLALFGASTYTGATNIENGTLQLAGANRLPVGTTVTLGSGANGGTLDLANQSQQLAGLLTSGTGTNRVIDSNNDATIPTLTLNVAGTNTFGGILGNTNQNGFALTKTGAGTLTLASDNTYTGTTTVSAGTLALQGNSGSPAFSIAGGAILEINVASGGRDYATSTTFTGAGTLRKTGAGQAYWGGAVATFSLSSGGLIDVQGGRLYGGSFGNDVWSANLADLNVAAGAEFYGVEANVRVDGITGTGTISTGFGGGGSVTVGVDNGTSTFGGTIVDNSSAGALTKAGTGTITLTGANTYTGTTTISAGTLQIGNGGGTGSIGGGAIVDNATLIVNRTGSITLGNVISGTGALTKQGSGTLILTGANSYTGLTTVSAGVLNIQHATALGGAGTGTTVASGAALQIQGGLSVAEPLTLNGTGVSSTGALVNVSGSNTFTGGITLGGNATIGVPAGTLTPGAINAATGLQGLTFNIASGATATLSSAIGAVNQPSNFTATGAGTLQLGTTISIGGNTTNISTPTVLIADTTINDTGGINFNAGATIDGAFTLTLNAGTGVGFASAVGGITPLANLNITNAPLGIVFSNAVTLAANGNLTANAGSTISLFGSSADLATSGTGAISLTAARDIVMSPGSSLAAVNGDITLTANLANVALGAARGIDVNGGSISSTGTGDISITGKGNVGIGVRGAGTISSSGTGTVTLDGTGQGAFERHGVDIVGAGTLITSSTGDIAITGQGGNGGANVNMGIFLHQGAVVSSTGAAKVTLTGTGGAGGTEFNYGVGIEDVNTRVQSVDGDVLITGTGGAGTGQVNSGIFIQRGAQVVSTGAAGLTLAGTGGSGTDGATGITITDGGVASSGLSSVNGNITLTGTATDTAGANLHGIRIDGSNAGSRGFITTTGTGTLSVTGTAGSVGSAGISLAGAANLLLTGAANTFNADSMSFTGTAKIDAGSNTVTLLQKTAGTAINLGGADAAGTLGLSDADLNAIAAGMLRIGNASTGAITVSADVNLDNNTPSVSTLLLTTSSGVTGTAGGIAVANLGILAGGAVNLTDASNDVTTLAINTTAGAITFSGDATGFTTNTAAGVSGITGPGAVTLSGGGLATIAGIGVNNTGGTGNVSVTSTGAGVTIAGNGIQTKGSVSLTADGALLVGSGGINSAAGTGTVGLTSNNGTVTVQDGGVVANGAVTVLAQGDVLLQGGNINAAGTTGGGVSVTSTAGAITTQNNSLTAKGAITFQAATNISHLGGAISNSGGASGDVSFTATSGAFLSNAGGIQTVGKATITAGGDVTVRGNGLDATPGSGDISITSSGGFVLINDGGVRGDGLVTVQGAGDVTVRGNGIAAAGGTGDVSVTSTGGTMLVNDGGIAAQGKVTVTSAGDSQILGTGITTLAGTGAIEVSSTGGTLLIDNSGIRGNAALSATAAGNVTIDGSGINGSSGTGAVTVTSTGGSITTSGGGVLAGNGSVLLQAQGATSDISLGAQTSSLGGTITVTAGRHISSTAPGTINPGAAGAITITADSDSSGSGNLTLAAQITNPTSLTVSLADAGGTLSGFVGGAGALVKNGAGTLAWSNSNNHTGTTTVNAGTLALVQGASNNPIASSPTITVAAGATLSVTGLDNGPTLDTLALASGQTLRGNGTVAGNVTTVSGSTVEPGIAGIGILTVTGGLTAAGAVNFQVNSPYAVAGVDYDQLVVGGTVDLSAATLGITGPGGGGATTVVTLVANGSGSATVASVAPPEAAEISISGDLFHIAYNAGDGNNVVLKPNIYINGSDLNDTIRISRDAVDPTLLRVSMTNAGGTTSLSYDTDDIGAFYVDGGVNFDTVIFEGANPIDFATSLLDIQAEQVRVLASISTWEFTSQSTEFMVASGVTIATTAGDIDIAATGSVRAAGSTLNASDAGDGDIRITAGGGYQFITVGTLTTDGGDLITRSARNLTVTGAINTAAGAIDLQAGGHVTLRGDVTGASFLSQGQNFTLASGRTLTTTAGDITITHTGSVKAGNSTMSASAAGDGDIAITAGGGKQALTVGALTTDGGDFVSRNARHFTATGAIATGAGVVDLQHSGNVTLRGDVTTAAFQSAGVNFGLASGRTLATTAGDITVTHTGSVKAGGSTMSAVAAGDGDITLTAGGGNQLAVVGNITTDGGDFTSSVGNGFTATGNLATGAGAITLTQGRVATLKGDVTGGSITSSGTALITSAGADIAVSGVIAFNHSLEMTIGGRLDAASYAINGNGPVRFLATGGVVFHVDLSAPPSSALFAKGGSGGVVFESGSEVVVDATGTGAAGGPHALLSAVSLINHGFSVQKTGSAAASVGDVTAAPEQNPTGIEFVIV